MPGTLVITTLSDGTNSTSATNPIIGSAKSWVNFGSTGGTVVIRSSFNTSSVTRTGAGSFTVNLSIVLADANCAICCGGKQDATFNDRMTQSYNISSSSYGLVFAAFSIGALDATWIFASVFR